jgi:hypothetical protein
MPYTFNFSPASRPDFPLGYPMNLLNKTHLVDEYICLNCWKGKVPGVYRERETVRKLYMVSGRNFKGQWLPINLGYTSMSYKF